jgi:hypothetical protein
VSSASEHRLTAPIYGYICLHTYMGIYVCTHIWVYMFTHIYGYICLHTGIYV